MSDLKYTNGTTVGAVLYHPLPHHLAGLSYTATGYGPKIPSPWMIVTVGTRDEGFRLTKRRVYSMVYGNSGSWYVLIKGEVHHLDLDTEYRIHAAAEQQAQLEYADSVLARANKILGE
ncbi:MAG: hypothetical protein JWO15_3922 [Sphingomonadales bacterium]|nr:hypothetical protein [Sphingomonadales bacterium]